MLDTIKKTIVAWAFNQIANYYFDNVNISQLHVALEKGEVELEGLIIKKEALRHLNIPIDVLWGLVGKLTIKVSLLTILMDPTQVKINILLENVSIYLSSASGLTKISLEKCNLDIQDEASNSIQLIVADFDKCLFYISDNTTEPCATPILEISLEDCRILLVLGKSERNGYIHGKLGGYFYNREVSTWDLLLDPWRFNLSWTFDLTEANQGEREIKNRNISLKSDEIANFYLTSAFLEICDIALLGVIKNFRQPEQLPLVRSDLSDPPKELHSCFLLKNETGFRLHFALNFLDKWTSVDAGGGASFETVPVHRKYIIDSSSRSQVLLLRVEGWKTLLPVPIDRTGVFFRNAFSDRIMNEDTTIAVIIELEEKSVRKIISVRSPINLVNLLDSSMELHFGYTKPNYPPAQHCFDLSRTPKKANISSTQNYKLTSYNNYVNLAERIAGQPVRLFNKYGRKATSDFDLVCPGLKLTLLNSTSEKLLEVSGTNIVIKCNTKAREQIIECSIQDVRIENLVAECEIVLLDRWVNLDDSIDASPAIRLIINRILGNSPGTTLLKQVQLSLSDFVLNLEERIILELVEFLNFKKRKSSRDLNKILHPDDRHSKYFFDLIRVELSRIKLSYFTSSNLNDALQEIKSYIGLKLPGFEDAHIELAPYFQRNISGTLREVFGSVTRFYRRQIQKYAPRIFGQLIQSYFRLHLPLLSTLYDEIYYNLLD